MNDKVNLKTKNETGSLIVESAIVFPIMFFLLLFIIYIGNMFYEQAKVENIVLKNAIYGAESIADPFHADMSAEKPSLPTNVKEVHIHPYRYLFGADYSAIEQEINDKVENEINSISLIFFNNSRANIKGTDNSNKKYAQYNRNFIYSNFVVQVNYEVKFPVRFLFTENPTIFTLSARAEVLVNDETEFIRNVDMAYDLLSQSKVGQAIGTVFSKVSSFIERFGLNKGN